MPALVGFGRRWACGSDDFVFPGIIDTTVKSCWLVSALFAFFRKNAEYENRNQLDIYFGGMIASLVIIILIDVIVVQRSAKGSIMDSDVRRIIVPLIYVRLFWEALDTGWNTVGTVWIFGHVFSNLETQDAGTFYFIRRYIICNWVSLIILSLFFAFLYDPLGSIEEKSDTTYSTAQSKFWAKKLKAYSRFFQNLPYENLDKKFQEIGRIFSYVLQDSNFVSSDVAAGLFAIVRQEEEKLHIILNGNESSEFGIRPLSLENLQKKTCQCSPSSDLIEAVLEIESYIPFTKVCNNWQKIANQHQHHIFNLFNGLRSCSRSLISSIESNGYCGHCKSSPLKEYLVASGIPDADVLHFSLKTDFYQFPFCLFMDHKSKCLILIINSTLSFANVVSYMDAWPIQLNIPGLPSTFMCHRGIYQASQKLLEKLNTLGIIEQLKKSYIEYNLVIVGERLSSGVATLLGIELFIEFPALKVVCINPTGGLLSFHAAKWTETFITSIVCENDVIANVNLSAIQDFKQHVINVIYECRTPKYKLLTGILLRFLGFKSKVRFGSTSESNLEGQENNGHNITISARGPSFPKAEAGNVQTKSDISKRSLTSHYKNIDVDVMYLPGKILYVTEKEVTIPGCEKNGRMCKCNIHWADRSEFFKMILSPGFLGKTSPDQIPRAISAYIEQHGRSVLSSGIENTKV